MSDSGAFAAVLSRAARHERSRAASWRLLARWSTDRVRCERIAAEYDGRARIYADWSEAMALEVSVDWIRYGCDRASLAGP